MKISLRPIAAVLAGLALSVAPFVGADSAVAAAPAQVSTPRVVMPAAATKPKIKVSPNKKLKDGQKVKVSGTGFPANTMIIVVECKNKSNCNKLKLASTMSTAKGSFSTTFKVFTGVVGKKTCKKGSTCMIGAAQAKLGATGYFATIKFKK